jgi:uncharacterized protein DUF4232
MLRRAWRRILMTFAGSAVVIALVATGAAAGLRAIDRNGRVVAQSSAPARCAAADLRGTVDLQGESGNVVASIVLTNRGARACSLSGRPGVTILDRAGQPLDVTVVAGEPWWKFQHHSRPSGWPAVTLPAGGSARVRTVWSNWCGTDVPATWRVELPDGGILRVPDNGHSPQCSAPASGSTLQVGPSEP